MTKRSWFLGGAAAVALIALAVTTRGVWAPEGAVAQAPVRPPPARVVPVEVAKAVKKPVPVRLEALGTVVPIASVVLKPRVDSVITGVKFADGAMVKEGDVLFTLDDRSIRALIAQAEGLVAKDTAQLEGAQRDLARYTDLVAKHATPVTNLDNTRTQVATFTAQLRADQASLENLKVMLSYCTIRAPITGKISAAAVKVGNFVRAGSDTVQLATINQMAPVYVSFGVPQGSLPDLRDAIAAKTASVEAVIPGDKRRAQGPVTMIDNTVDAATGMVSVRATMPNADGLLWPGTLVDTYLTLRTEESITVPSTAVQVSQTGSYVFVVKDGAAKVQPIKIDRTVGAETVIASGVQEGDMVVTDGQLLLSNGTKVAPRTKKVGA